MTSRKPPFTGYRSRGKGASGFLCTRRRGFSYSFDELRSSQKSLSRKVNQAGSCVLRASPILAVITGIAWQKNITEVHPAMPMQFSLHFSSSWGPSEIDRLQTIVEGYAVILFVFGILLLYQRHRANIYFKRRLRKLGIDEYVLYDCQTELVEQTVERLKATAEQAGRQHVTNASVKRALDDVVLTVVAWVQEGPGAIQDTRLEYVQDILWEFQVPSRVSKIAYARTLSEDEWKQWVLVWVLGVTVMIGVNVGMYVMITDGLDGPLDFLGVGFVLFIDVSIGGGLLWKAFKRVTR
jgi:hypothetical protein